MRTIAFLVGFAFYLNEAGLQKLANMNDGEKIIVLLALGLFLFLDIDAAGEKGFNTRNVKPRPVGTVHPKPAM